MFYSTQILGQVWRSMGIGSPRMWMPRSQPGSLQGYKRKLDEHHRDVGIGVLTAHKALLKKNKNVRDYSNDVVASLFHTAGVSHH
jgi:hypothetical protein